MAAYDKADIVFIAAQDFSYGLARSKGSALTKALPSWLRLFDAAMPA
jgi:hypothetical protein